MESGPNTYWVGRYRLSARIATGGMAEVYLGRRFEDDGARGPAVAVKRLMPHLASDRRVVQMFLNEARITAQVRHPNVVSILELGMEGTEPFIAMELLEGRSFAELRQEAAERGQRVPLGITLRVLVEACRGLDAAHRAVDEAGRPLRIVHRDFTPDNIHVGVNGAVKVIDFGIAKADALGAGTEPGVLKGKFFYMSPEMIAGKPVDHRADLFAAGVMLYEQLCGRRPFTGMTAEEVLGRIAEGRARPPTAFDPSVPAALELVCLTALQRDPAARFDSLESFIDAIEAIGGQAEVATGEQVAAYVDTLFPPDRDPKRQALRRARMADPSHGGTPPIPRAFDPNAAPHNAMTVPAAWPKVFLPDVGATLHGGEPPDSVRPPTPTSPGSTEAATVTGFRASSPGVVPPSRPGSATDSTPPARNPTDSTPPTRNDSGITQGGPRRRSRWGLVLGGVLGLAALGAGGTWYLTRTESSPTERLAKAQAADAPTAKVSLLSGLGEDTRATAEELAQAGTVLLTAGAHFKALELAEAYVARFPKDVEAHLLAARAATELNRGKRAERALDEALTLAPKDLRPSLMLADLRERQGDLPGAVAALAKAYAQKPGVARVAPRYGRMLSQNGRLDEAASVLSAWTREHDDAASLAELGFVRFRQERVDEAAALLKRALRKDGKLAVAHYYLGAVLFRQGDSTGAERAYREADRLAPEDPRALAARCQLHAHGGNETAVAEVKRTLEERFPERANVLAAECKAGN
ncbi:protein kinase [Myxococcus llanfairpwllgwyngyllgogerychwyrndrobwllllantysiliogogogochensis]|uniref:Protein kinase n=2 Tax=Myxococcus llanfairpwllgwyngyllgogerychwyrndrobwllllantysiliogogogochensis TaxID=2590453 RepID=A0A540WT46_9BACT|nr:serine/threonine-protein kinase [Myxococcus llanfairpwllgwyngyllgogerychwyrndrobwllllantysiliogogogochensis]TQF12178.1 protein kinase [Myxococcus llanfairpwllgwyngyllgogerychwyrndrobwllllantysiliogogogochensis]